MLMTSLIAHLVGVVVSLEEGLLFQHQTCEHAAGAPEVEGRTVQAVAHQQLGALVEAGGHTSHQPLALQCNRGVVEREEGGG
jgi:hypothetical protein